MLLQDYFVGMVSVLVGAFALAGAALNVEWYYQLKKARWIESWSGRGGARAFYALVGLGLIALGIAIACGFAPNKCPGRKVKPSSPGDTTVEVDLPMAWSG